VTKLTMLEQETLVMMVEHPETQAELAKRFSVSRMTLHKRIRGMYEKTNTENPVQLVRWAIGQAIIVGAAAQIAEQSFQKEPTP